MSFRTSCITLLATIAGYAAWGDVTPWDMSGYADMNQDYATKDNCQVQSDTTVVGSTYKDSSVTIAANNTTAGDYVMDFMAGAKDVDATFSVTVTSEDYTWEGDYNVTRNGSNWTPNETKYLQLKGLPAGAFTIKLVVLTTTKSYGGNYGKFEIKACSPLATSGEAIDLAGAKEKGVLKLSGRCNVKENNTCIENTKKSDTFSFELSVSDEAKYTIAYKYGASSCSAKLGWSLVNQDSATVASGTDIIENTGTDWSLKEDYTHEFGELPAGVYFFKATVDEITSGSYAGNYGNFTWTQTEFTRHAVTAPCNEGTTVEVTAGDKVVKGANDVYNVREDLKTVVSYSVISSDYYFEEGVQTVFIEDYVTEDVSVTAPIATKSIKGDKKVDDIETASKLNWTISGSLFVGGTKGCSGNLTIMDSTVKVQRFNLAEADDGTNVLTIGPGGKLITTGDPTSGHNGICYLGYGTSTDTLILNGGYLETAATLNIGRNGYQHVTVSLTNGAILKAAAIVCPRTELCSLSMDATSKIITKSIADDVKNMIAVPTGYYLKASAADAEGYVTYSFEEGSATPTIDPTSDIPSVRVTAGDSTAATNAVQVTIPAAVTAACPTLTAAQYKSYFTFSTQDNGDGTWTVTITGLADELTADVYASVVEGGFESVTVPTGLYYKITTGTTLKLEDGESKADLSNGGVVTFTKPGESNGFVNGFVKVQLSASEIL